MEIHISYTASVAEVTTGWAEVVLMHVMCDVLFKERKQCLGGSQRFLCRSSQCLVESHFNHKLTREQKSLRVKKQKHL